MTKPALHTYQNHQITKTVNGHGPVFSKMRTRKHSQTQLNERFHTMWHFPNWYGRHSRKCIHAFHCPWSGIHLNHYQYLTSWDPISWDTIRRDPSDENQSPETPSQAQTPTLPIVTDIKVIHPVLATGPRPPPHLSLLEDILNDLYSVSTDKLYHCFKNIKTYRERRWFHWNECVLGRLFCNR